MRIRDATIDDIPALVRLGAQMHADSTFADMDYDEQTTGRTVLTCIESDDQIALAAETGDGDIVGGFLGASGPSFFGRDRVSFDLATYVEPSNRGGCAAYCLLRRYLEWAESLGCKRINIGNSAGMDDRLFVRLTERLGFQRAGSIMFKRG